MLERLKSYLLWIRRCPYSRGFGIQSPSAYSFVRYVVNEHYPYYAYEELDAQNADHTPIERKVGRLLFRIANFWQPQCTFIDSPSWSSYISAGCRKTQIVEWGRLVGRNKLSDEKTLLVIDIDQITEEQQRILMQQSDAETLLVVLDIHACRKAKDTWRRIVDDEHTGVAFDLYHCGVVFFDKSKHKRQYVVNF